MRWQALRLQMDGSGTGERVWKMLWAASVVGEQPDEGSAIFMLDGDRGSRTLYFPPSAGVLAASVGARSCVKPDADGLTVLAGRPGAWHVHFGDAPAAATQIDVRVRAA